MKALIGRKIGMLSVFNGEGQQVPVTAIELGPCVVVQRKTRARDGYEAAQLGFLPQKPSRVTKPLAGHFGKSEAVPHRELREVRCAEGEAPAGETLDLSLFEGVEHVDIVGTSKGRGFQGVVKRYRMAGGRASHGSGTHRRPGSIGMCVDPARVLKNKKMPGHMGNRRVTTQNLKVVQLRPEDHVLLVRGAVTGPNGGIVIVREAIKRPARVS